MGLQFEFNQQIDAPRELVFEALTDLDAFAEYADGDVKIERLDDGPYGVGATWKETRTMFGKDASEYFEVVECDSPERLALFVDGSKGSSGRGEYHYTYELTSTGDGTELTLDARMENMGWLGAIFGRLFSGTFKKAIQADIDRLKEYAESGGTIA